MEATLDGIHWVMSQELTEVLNTYEACNKKDIRFLDFLWGLRGKVNCHMLKQL